MVDGGPAHGRIAGRRMPHVQGGDFGIEPGSRSIDEAAAEDGRGLGGLSREKG